jgi:hypothetical protein
VVNLLNPHIAGRGARSWVGGRRTILGAAAVHGTLGLLALAAAALR